MNSEKINIRSLDKIAISAFLTKIGENQFHSKQIWEWIWKKSVTSFNEMTNLSKNLRSRLEDVYCFQPIIADKTQVSEDGTLKLKFKLFDGNFVEGVLIPTEDRMTACISSQVGCNVACKFCATGYMKRKRNLTYDEIYDQVVQINALAMNRYGQNLTNIVFMGMGEPLQNYKNVLKGIHFLTSEEGLGIASKRITVSTSGITNMIKKLGDDQVKFRLAISLHAADDKKRNQIMPINETNNLNDLLESLQYFYNKTKTRITFEYILLENINDSKEDAKKLAKFSRKIPSKINIIEYNPIQNADFKKTSVEKLNLFNQYLLNEGVFVSVRRSRGKDIQAACGQLITEKSV